MADKHIEFTEEVITPEKAHEYLALNHPNNRTLVKAKADAYARDVAAGKWRLTHQGIAFDKQGRLIDGQHRLMAIIKAGRPATMIVARYKDSASLMVLDQGRSRTIHDAMTVLYGKGHGLHTTITSFIRHFNEVVLGGAGTLTAQEIVQWADRYPELVKVARVIIRASGAKISAVVTSACVCASINGVDTGALVAFCRAMYRNEPPQDRKFFTKAALDFADTLRGRVAIYAHRRSGLVLTENAIYQFVTGKVRLLDRSVERYPVTIEMVDAYHYVEV